MHGATARATWQASMAVLAERLTRAALDREAVPDAGLSQSLKNIGAALGLRRDSGVSAREQAMRRLAERRERSRRRSECSRLERPRSCQHLAIGAQ